MTNGSVDVDDVGGDVSGVTIGGTGTLSGKHITVRGHVNY